MTFGKCAVWYLLVAVAIAALLTSNEGVVGQTFTLTMTTNGTTETFTQEPTTYTHTGETNVFPQPTTAIGPPPADSSMIIMLMGLVIVVLVVVLVVMFAKLRNMKSQSKPIGN
jgi:beta-lactamase regulating signal transducer with metallopeptidase domain